jgi:glyoxylase-like metal-dependent hydrolase (beta-lactamase superfamily II)
MTLTIHPLDLGTLNVDKSGLTLRKGLVTRVDAPRLGYLILGSETPILVDSGPCADPDWGTQHHNPFRRNPDQTLDVALARHGLAPDDIRTVVITHLHWDYCYGNTTLPQARFIVQRRELSYAVAPPALRRSPLRGPVSFGALPGRHGALRSHRWRLRHRTGRALCCCRATRRACKACWSRRSTGRP